MTTARDDALDLLRGMAVSLRYDIDLDFLLADLATGVRHTLDAERVSVLLLDDDGRLTPAVAVARQHNDELWQRFRRMPPITLEDVPGARQALARGDVLVIDDASSSPLIPSAWQRTFSLGSLAVAPLVVDGSPAGLVAVEFDDVAARCTPTQLALLEGMAALAGVALRAGRQRSHAQRLEKLAGTIAELAGLRTTRAVAEQALSAALDTADLSTGLFALLSECFADVVAVRGPHLPEPGRYALTELPPELVTSCRRAWDVEAPALVTVDVTGRRLALQPVGAPPVAAVVLPMTASLTSPDVLGELQLLAAATAVQLRSARLSERREWDRRALSLLAAASVQADAASIGGFVDDACRLIQQVGVKRPTVVVDRSIARHTGLPAARGDIARLLARWRRTPGRGGAAVSGEHTAVPLYAGEQVLGVLVTGGGDVPVRVNPILTVLGDAIGRAAVNDHVKDLELRAANAASHTAVASRAYREAGQLLALLANSLQTTAAQSPRSAGADALVGQVRRLLRDATEVLAPSAAPQADLRIAFTALAKQVAAHGGPEIGVRQLGSAPVLDAAVQVALLRAAQRVFALLREARAVAATVVIEPADGEVRVTIRTGELLGAARETTGAFAVRRDARAWLDPVGGTLELAVDEPAPCFVLRAPRGARELARKPVNEATSRQTGQAL